MEWYLFLAVIGVGFLAGFINTLAGGGSILTLPMLMFLGLPAPIANGSNRIAIMLQNIVGVKTFSNNNAFKIKADSKLAIPAILGAIPGAFLAVDINETIMKNVITIVLVIMFVMVILDPEKWNRVMVGEPKAKWWHYILFFFIGVYGGFIQVGTGFFLIGALVLGSGYDLVRGNAVKKWIILLYTPFALAVYIFNDQVNYVAGFTLALGTMLGSYAGAKFAVKHGSTYIRYFLLLALVLSVVKLLFDQ